MNNKMECEILYIDDQGWWLRRLREAWKLQNIEVHTAQNLPEAIHILSKYGRNIKLVLIDLLMPDPETGENEEKEGGRKIAKRIKEKLKKIGRPHVPIWCITGLPAMENRPDKIIDSGEKIRDYGEFQGVIYKPKPPKTRGQLPEDWIKDTAKRIKGICERIKIPHVVLFYKKHGDDIQIYKAEMTDTGEYVPAVESAQESKEELLKSPIFGEIIKTLINKTERKLPLILTHREILKCREKATGRSIPYNRQSERTNQTAISRLRSSLRKFVNASYHIIEPKSDPQSPKKALGYKFNFNLRNIDEFWRERLNREEK